MLITEGLDENTSLENDEYESSNIESTDLKTDSTLNNNTKSEYVENELKLDLCKNNNNSTLSLTDKNLLFLNDRINILNANYLDLSMNLIKLETQLKDNAVKSSEDATDLVGDTPINIT